MLGSAAMIAVLLAPTANIARHDDHRIGGNGVRGSIVTPWIPSRSDFKRTSPMAGRSSAPCARSRRTRSWSGSRTPAAAAEAEFRSSSKRYSPGQPSDQSRDNQPDARLAALLGGPLSKCATERNERGSANHPNHRRRKSPLPFHFCGTPTGADHGVLPNQTPCVGICAARTAAKSAANHALDECAIWAYGAAGELR